MDGFLLYIVAVDQTAGIGLVGWIVLDDFSMGDRMENLRQGQFILLGFVIGMIADANTIRFDGLYDPLNIHIHEYNSPRAYCLAMNSRV